MMDALASRILPGIAIGAGATLAMDLWNLFLKRAFGIPSLNYCLLGRWLRSIPEGKFRHDSIAATPAKAHECAVGWTGHYGIGISLALGFGMLAPAGWLARPTPLPALGYGIATVVFPFFILQPALGLGIASSRTARPAQARLKSLATHTVFGIAMYLCALGLSRLLPAGA